MPSTTRYKRGDIVLVSFPFTDLSTSKRRPALVVSPDSFNETMRDLVLAATEGRLFILQHCPRTWLAQEHLQILRGVTPSIDAAAAAGVQAGLQTFSFP
jgi:hypothetical protein